MLGYFQVDTLHFDSHDNVQSSFQHSSDHGAIVNDIRSTVSTNSTNIQINACINWKTSVKFLALDKFFTKNYL